MPERMIRTLFISSLYSKLFKVDVLDICLMHKINQMLMVCENDYAIGAGIRLSKVFWDGVELKHFDVHLNEKNEITLTKEAEEMIAIQIIGRTPQWLLYNRADMVIDIRKMIERRLDLKVMHLA